MTNAHTEVFPISTSTPSKITVGVGVGTLHILKNVGDAVVYLVSDGATMAGAFNVDNAINLAPGDVLYDIPNAVNDVDSSFLWALSVGRASRLVAIY